MTRDGNEGPTIGAALTRFLGFAALWGVLIRSGQPGDLAVGALTAAAATWASLRLLPPATGQVRFAVLAARSPRFLWQSILAGIDVARRALAPRMPLAAGFVAYRTGLPRGQARNTFATITSVLPGTVPVADDDTGMVYHCLDTGQPVTAQLAADERAYGKALVPGRAHG
ncbi:MAG: Na+/H+ antiporter subunit E [Burkholderiales bacterium]|nr:Na+/H+ antiporter subunit E [Burkholderiales bacterium]